MTPQPFWTSKGFWSSIIGLAIVLYAGFKSGQWNVETIGAALMFVLANIFRWTADQPLSLTGGKNIATGSAAKRLTRD